VNDIKTSWKDFGLTIIYPWAIFFLILTVIFMILQFIYSDPVLNRKNGKVYQTKN